MLAEMLKLVGCHVTLDVNRESLHVNCDKTRLLNWGCGAGLGGLTGRGAMAMVMTKNLGL